MLAINSECFDRLCNFLCYVNVLNNKWDKSKQIEMCKYIAKISYSANKLSEKKPPHNHRYTHNISRVYVSNELVPFLGWTEAESCPVWTSGTVNLSNSAQQRPAALQLKDRGRYKRSFLYQPDTTCSLFYDRGLRVWRLWLRRDAQRGHLSSVCILFPLQITTTGSGSNHSAMNWTEGLRQHRTIPLLTRKWKTSCGGA